MSFLINAVTPSSQVREIPTASIIDGRPTLQGDIPNRTQQRDSQLNEQEVEALEEMHQIPQVIQQQSPTHPNLSPVSSGAATRGEDERVYEQIFHNGKLRELQVRDRDGDEEKDIDFSHVRGGGNGNIEGLHVHECR